MNEPLRFCLITTFYPPYNFGGDGFHVQRLAQALAARGHQVDVIHCGDSYRLLSGHAPEPSATANQGNPRIHTLRSWAGFLSPLATQQTGRPIFKSAAIKKILRAGHDVIHFHNISLIGGPGILQFGSGVKLMSLHEEWIHCPMHVLWRFDREVCKQPRCVECQLRGRRPPQLWRYGKLMRQSLPNVGAFIAPSQFSSSLHRRLGLDGRIEVLPNFLNHSELSGGKRTEATTQKPFFLFVGRLERMKGIESLVSAFRQFSTAELLVAGDGPLGQSLRSDLPASVKFLGFQTKSNLDAIYRQCRALIVPTIGYEAFGQVILEAWAHSTPVLAYNLGGPAELLGGGGGRLYRTQEELLSWIHQYLDDPEFRDKDGADGAALLRSRYTDEGYMEQYFRLIDDLRGEAAKGQ